MKLVGLSGYARAGKDEAADILVENFGFTRIAFADKLREALYELNPSLGWTWDYSGESDRPRDVSLKSVIDRHGWAGYKETQYVTEIRRLLQRLGTEVGRNLLGENIWVEATFRDLNPLGRYVVTDMRFPNEIDAVNLRGGTTVRIERAGNSPANAHISETAIDHYYFDHRLYNNSTLDIFRQSVMALGEKL